MTTLTLCDGCGDEISHTFCEHHAGDWCPDCAHCQECLLEAADAYVTDLTLARWKGEA